jgi:acyl-CoA reductase-like NAD-dependent aldehyde dehydrogenase
VPNLHVECRAAFSAVLDRATAAGATGVVAARTAAYRAPVALLAPPGAGRLMHEEPFGPGDTIVVVDTEAELLALTNASNGALVASIARDDAELASELAELVQAVKVGINKPRPRGDRPNPSVRAARRGRERSSAGQRGAGRHAGPAGRAAVI